MVHDAVGDPAQRARAADRRLCLRIGYTTILLGALGYFGLGMPPESPNWGTMIKELSRFMRIYIHPALPRLWR